MKEKDAFDSIAELARVFSDPSRVRIVSLLTQEREGLTTLDICARLGLLQPRVSSHLSKLLKHSLVSVTEEGRQRIYRLASDRISPILEDLGSFSTTPKARMKAIVSLEVDSGSGGGHFPKVANREIRECRTCYDHLAGVVGVELLDRMLLSAWLSEDTRKAKSPQTKPFYKVTKLGSKKLLERGVNLEEAAKSNRTFAYGCQDWTEKRPHLGGALGNAVLNSILSQGIVERKIGTRALKVAKPISAWTA